MAGSYRPLLASYGGGHAQIIAALAREMTARGIIPTVLGFTTAYRYLLRAGVNAVSVEDLIDPDADAEYLEAVTPFITSQSHPDVTKSETQAYFALGLRGLVEQHGWKAALDAVAKHGRKVFEPISSMRRYLDRIRPDIVVTTTSPRFELALLKAARRSAIPTLAVADLFLTHEREYVVGNEYAEYLAVLGEEVADDINSVGFSRSKIRVTGNPAFDTLAASQEMHRRSQLREKLGVDEKTVILWPLAGTASAYFSKPFHPIDAITNTFERLCQDDPSFTYILREHPNWPLAHSLNMGFGLLDDGKLSLEDALLICDVVCFEISTVGLQAILLGKPAVSTHSDVLSFARFDLVTQAKDLDDMITILKERRYSSERSFKMPPLGSATSNVLSFIDDILAA